MHGAGLHADACEIVFEGADRGKPKEKPKPPEPFSYSRSVPLDKALNDVLIAYSMNGVELPRDHGFPVRAIVPGHYGMASVKWLDRILVVTTPFQGYWQTTEYAYWDRASGVPIRRPFSKLKLKSAIARPRMLELVPKAQVYRIYGAAWSGEADAVTAEVTTVAGKRGAPPTSSTPSNRTCGAAGALSGKRPSTPALAS
jgi:DMSO/TMAO reductase YedYZ molybdopterin-dependent catalytic subunit